MPSLPELLGQKLAAGVITTEEHAHLMTMVAHVPSTGDLEPMSREVAIANAAPCEMGRDLYDAHAPPHPAAPPPTAGACSVELEAVDAKSPVSSGGRSRARLDDGCAGCGADEAISPPPPPPVVEAGVPCSSAHLMKPVSAL